MKKLKHMLLVCLVFALFTTPIVANETQLTNGGGVTDEVDSETNQNEFDESSQDDPADEIDDEEDLNSEETLDEEETSQEGNSELEEQTGDEKETEVEDEELEYEEIQDDEIVNEEIQEDKVQDQIQRSKVTTSNAKAVEPINVSYSTHVSSIGWKTSVKDGATSGETSGISRIEGLKIKLDNSKYSGNITYQSHVQGIGWQKSVSNNALSGTTGQSRRVEALRINLDGEVAKHYNVYYRVYVYGVGWLDWTSNGGSAGTEGYSRQIQAVQIKVLPKSDTSISVGSKPFYKKAKVTYQVHSQSVGWMAAVSDGKTAGTSGRSLRMESFKISLPDELKSTGQIRYKTHIQSIGWQDWKYDGNLAGTTGRSLRLEALQVELTGANAQNYDVYYRVHAQGVGWLGWAKNGTISGSVGQSRRLEAIEIQIVAKGMPAPGAVGGAEVIKNQYTPVYYSQHNSSWANKKYGRWTMSQSGCLPTSLAMAISGITGKSVKPDAVANYLYNNTSEFNKSMAGASGLAVQKAASNYGVKWEGLSSVSQVDLALSQGKIVIAVVGPGVFTGRGTTHAIVLYNYSGGKTYVMDPNSSSKNGWYSLSTIWNQKSTDSYDLRGGYVFYALSK